VCKVFSDTAVLYWLILSFHSNNIPRILISARSFPPKKDEKTDAASASPDMEINAFSRFFDKNNAPGIGGRIVGFV